jgi:uncharacterized membrane protein
MVVSMIDAQNAEHEELRLLYQTAVGEIAFFKQQQWSVTNYALLIFAGLVGVAWHFDTPLACWESRLAFLFAVITFMAAWLVLAKLQRSIEIRRSRLQRVRERFTQAFRDAIGEKSEENEATVYRLLRLVLVLGVIAVGWLVFHKFGTRVELPEYALAAVLV